MTEQGRFNPAPLGWRILARSGRLARAGGARFASQAVARHRNPTLGRQPRLLPVRSSASPASSEYSPAPAPEQPVAQGPVAVPRPGGISEEAAKWLFLGERGPSMLPMSALKPAPPPVTRKVARSAVPRPRLEEGPSVRSTSAGTPLPRSPQQAERRGGAVGEVDSVPGARPDVLRDPAEPVVDGAADPAGDAEPSERSLARASEPAGDAQPAGDGTPAVTPRSRSLTRPSASATLARRAASTPAELRSAAPAQRLTVSAGKQPRPAIADAPAGPSATEPHVSTRSALSREPPKVGDLSLEPPKVGDKVGEASVGEKALEGETHPKPAAAAVPAPVAPSARPLRRLRPAGPARKVASKASSSVLPEPRQTGRAEPEVAAGALTPHGVPSPPAVSMTATDDEAAPPRIDTTIEQAAESGARKARDAGDETPLARMAPTGRETERPTVLARRASGSGAGFEPSTGSARVVANPPAANSSLGRRSDELVATPQEGLAAPPADVAAPSPPGGSPVTGAEALAGLRRKPIASSDAAPVVRSRNEAAPAGRRESEAASTAVRPSVESAGSAVARVLSRSTDATAEASVDVQSQLRFAPPDPAPPDAAPPDPASPAARTAIARATASDAQPDASDPPESEPTHRRGVAASGSAAHARPGTPQPTPARRGGQPVARPADESDATSASGARRESEAAFTAARPSVESPGMTVGHVLSRSPDPAPEASTDVPSYERPAPRDSAPPDPASAATSTVTPTATATATDAHSQASDPPGSKPTPRHDVVEPASATRPRPRVPQPTPKGREGAFRLAPARARPGPAGPPSTERLGAVGPPAEPVGALPLSVGPADAARPSAAPSDAAPLPPGPDETPARREHPPAAMQSALPSQATEPVSSAWPGSIARSASPMATTAPPASAAAVGDAHGPAADAPPPGPARPSSTGSPAAATPEPQPDRPTSTNHDEAHSPRDAPSTPLSDIPSATPRAVSSARLSKSTPDAGERLDATDAPGAPKLPMPTLRISNAIEEPPAAGVPDPAPDGNERPATAGPVAEAASMPTARLRGQAVARKRASVRTSAAGDAEPPISDARRAGPDATEPSASGGPAVQKSGVPGARFRGNAVARKRASAMGFTASNANPPAPMSRVPAGPPRPTATATSAPVDRPAPSREPVPTPAATAAPAAVPVTTDAPTPTVTGADPDASVKPSPPSVAAATAGVPRGSVARVTVAGTPTAPEPTSETPDRRETSGRAGTPARFDTLRPTEAPAGTHQPGRSEADARTSAPGRPARRRLSRAAVGGPTDRNPLADLSSLRPLRVSRRAAPPVERRVGFHTHAETAVSGEAPASRITAVIPGNTRPPVRAHIRVTGPSPPGTAAPTVAAAATETAPMHTSEPEPTPQPYFPLTNVPHRPSGHSLARAIGVTRESDGSGRSTVVFPQPPGRGMHPGTSRTARPLARQTIELETASVNSHGPDAVPTAAAEPSTYDTGDFEELYDRVLSRLRRDLIVERERRGDLSGAYLR